MKEATFQMFDARSPEQVAATDREFPYGCNCGEQYSNMNAARFCRKCRTYLPEGQNTGEVVDMRTGVVVWAGVQPEEPWQAPDWLTLECEEQEPKEEDCSCGAWGTITASNGKVFCGPCYDQD